jgi:tripartite-type tricarboxylate transporter receptor subunit TctC
MAFDAPTRRAVLTTLLASLPVTLPRIAAAAAESSDFPQRAVRIVVPYSVGIGPDVVARSVAEQLSQQWGQTVLVENRPGASGIVAFNEVRRTVADGYTLFLADTATMAVNPLLHDVLPYDPMRDLVPLTMLFRATFVIWVGGSSRWRNLAELQDAARRSPGKISYGTLGNGHASHVSVESYARAAGLHMLHVPFKEAGALFTAVAVGDVDFMTFSVNSVAGLMASGKLRPLAVAARQRLASNPEIPTLVEAGGPPVEMHPWAALVAVAGTPAPVLEKLRRSIALALDTDEVRRPAALAGFEITPSTPQAVRARIEADIAIYRPLVDEGRITRL